MGRIVGGRVLVPSVRGSGWLAPDATVFWDSGTITEVSAESLLAGLDERDGWELDAGGSLVLPGMVNLYDNSFDSGAFGSCAVTPMGPSLGARLRNHAADLAASAITTSFLSVGDTGAPMSRAPGSIREIADALSRGNERCVDLRLNVRHGAYGTEHVRELVDLMQLRAISMVTHLHGTLHPPSHEQAVREIGRLQARRLTNVAAGVRCVTASLGAAGPEHVADDLELGVRLALLPSSIEVARKYTAADVRILVDTDGPRRRSALDGPATSGDLALSGRDAWTEGLRPLLGASSDHRSMLVAAFEFARQIGDLPQAWAGVSRGPAVAAGLLDRGQLSPGHRADILVVDPPVDGRPPQLRALVAGGRVVLCRPDDLRRDDIHEQDDGLERWPGPSIVGGWSPP